MENTHELKAAEQRVLAIANFVQENFSAYLISKDHVVQLLLWAARAAVDTNCLEIQKSWLTPDLENLYIKIEDGNKHEKEPKRS